MQRASPNQSDGKIVDKIRAKREAKRRREVCGEWRPFCQPVEMSDAKLNATARDFCQIWCD